MMSNGCIVFMFNLKGPYSVHHQLSVLVTERLNHGFELYFRELNFKVSVISDTTTR